MKLRGLFLIGAGIAIGYSIASKLREDDPNVVSGPQRSGADQRSRTVRLVSSQAQRLADRASERSIVALRKARGAIRQRLDEDSSYYDDAAWS
jgi:hypothetical protein